MIWTLLDSLAAFAVVFGYFGAIFAGIVYGARALGWRVEL